MRHRAGVVARLGVAPAPRSAPWKVRDGLRLELATVDRSRIQGYAVLLLGSCLAGLLGLVFDQLTVTISPEYFTLGKGLSPEALREQVGWLGFRSALPLGALVTGLGLVAGRSARAFSWPRWLVSIAVPIALALCAAPVAMALLDPFGVRASSSGVMADGACSRYLVAWGLHVGAYVGFVVGVCVALVRARGR